MLYIKPGIPFSFNYVDGNLTSGLNIQASVFDVTNGIPALIDQIPLVEIEDGYYFGDELSVSGKTYLVISVPYTDNTFAVIDTSKSPSAEIYKTYDAPFDLVGFNYGVFNQNAGLSIQGNIFDVTNGTPTLVDQVPMPHIMAGVYYGFFSGTIDHAYEIVKLVYTNNSFSTVNTNYSPGSDSVQSSQIRVVDIFFAGVLNGQSNSGTKLKITQGDTATLRLIATDGNGNRVDLTGATLTSEVRGVNGLPIFYPNSQHTIDPDQIFHKGEFDLALSILDTTAIPEGEDKGINTEIVIGPSTIYYHGDGILNVLSSIPRQ